MESSKICAKPDGEICHRFSPAMGQELCLRCDHTEQCHTRVGESAVCFFRRDDKTIDTCREKFANLPRNFEYLRIFDYRIAGNPAYNLKVELDPAERARLRWAMIDGVREMGKHAELAGFRLIRIWFRSAEDWRRLWDQAPPDAQSRGLEPAQIGSFYLPDIGNVPVCEHAFLPEEKMVVRLDPAKMSAVQVSEAEQTPRRVICALQYGRCRIPVDADGFRQRWSEARPVVESDLRIHFLTE